MIRHPAPAAVLLFDIDLTLIDSAGAGREAMNRAFESLYAVARAFDEIPFAGRTDTELIREALDRHGRSDGEAAEAMGPFSEVYASHLAEVLPQRPGRRLPGVRELLCGLAARDDVVLGLATGNLRRGAELKLRHYGLDDLLFEGGFGDDDADRARVVAIGAQRLGFRAGAAAPVVAVVGDTPRDVSAARANGFLSLAVATGFHDHDTLRSAGADLVLGDFEDHERARRSLLDLVGLSRRTEG